MAYFVKGSDGKLVETAFNLPEDFIADGIGIELTASTATINREIEKQGLMAMMGQLSQYYQQLLQISGVAMNPATPPPIQQLALEMADGARYLMSMIVQTYEIRAVDTLLPQSITGGSQNGQPPGPPGGPPQGPAEPGVAASVGPPPASTPGLPFAPGGSQ
jgi:hypothetical protein